MERSEENEPTISRDDIVGAVACGWCYKVNEKKMLMDSDLALAIVDEVMKILPQKIKGEENG